MNKTYNLSNQTFVDIFEKIPVDRQVESLKALHAVIDLYVEIINDNGEVCFNDDSDITWTDDSYMSADGECDGIKYSTELIK